jgi:predicted DNA-binding transcriptional regulator AlpA
LNPQISDSPETDFLLLPMERLWRTLPMSKSVSTERNSLSLEEFCVRNGIGRTTAYKEIKEGRLHPKKIGRRTLISIVQVPHEQKEAVGGLV